MPELPLAVADRPTAPPATKMAAPDALLTDRGEATEELNVRLRGALTPGSPLTVAPVKFTVLPGAKVWIPLEPKRELPLTFSPRAPGWPPSPASIPTPPGPDAEPAVPVWPEPMTPMPELLLPKTAVAPALVTL